MASLVYVQSLIRRSDATVLKNFASELGVSRSVMIKAILVRFIHYYLNSDYESVKEDLGL